MAKLEGLANGVTRNKTRKRNKRKKRLSFVNVNMTNNVPSVDTSLCWNYFTRRRPRKRLSPSAPVRVNVVRIW
ncbi:hypothetical protein F441_00277 [Phytophthora nicotianae CJ01A1]|uniref:Uncharacterized protein n=1 Tax=Phytophthora nicotianae CJ01A1 TaxID=1317063 RepID=W2XXV0_PHYNI|nr:hypothetical protein F441_00277 [Phytophthora nicotianae CJ01A1]